MKAQIACVVLALIIALGCAALVVAVKINLAAAAICVATMVAFLLILMRAGGLTRDDNHRSQDPATQ